ncbi:hypothetical protein [Phreatobacter sp.]|uniref:hypothetical protein n=1 Tax=Phreatobacter sp. TaxID=1966341 RepID=UPI003F7052D4
MDVTDFLTPTDARQPDGWPNPRSRMTCRVAIAARIVEDGRRIATETGACTEACLTRLGWRLEQVKGAQADLAAACDALEQDLARTKATAEAIRQDHAPVAHDDVDVVEAPSIREPALTDDDIAFGCERAA